MITAPAVARSVLADQVRDRLLEAILSGHYPPDSRIVETQVARP
jgi:DNA-binding GntR family transcriptional regulator